MNASTSPTSHFKRYQALLSAAAKSHLDRGMEACADLSQVDETDRDSVVSLAIAVPAARRLLGESVDLDAQAHAQPHAYAASIADASRIIDGFGHSREVYRPLALHIRHLGCHGQAQAADLPRGGGRRPLHGQDGHGQGSRDSNTPLARKLWHSVLRGHSHPLTLDDLRPSLESAGEPSPLQPFEHHGGTLEGWWYHELAGLHALANLVWLSSAIARPQLLGRMYQIVDYHIQHTEADNATAQPWALAAFLARSQTLGFAETQLHNSEIALTQSEGRSGLTSGLLLTDAAHTLSQLEPILVT